MLTDNNGTNSLLLAGQKSADSKNMNTSDVKINNEKISEPMKKSKQKKKKGS